jgi:lysophospholipase L1-like esterase
MNDLAIPLPTRNQIEQMYADSISENTDRIQAVLESNLRSIVSNCLARGAKPVLISYPRPSYIEGSMSKIATEKNISYINVRLKFDQALQTRKQDELFAADGHCNDEGYSIIANAIASMIKNW